MADTSSCLNDSVCPVRETPSLISHVLKKIETDELVTAVCDWIFEHEILFIRQGHTRSSVWKEFLYQVRCNCRNNSCWINLSTLVSVPEQAVCPIHPSDIHFPETPLASKQWLVQWLQRDKSGPASLRYLMKSYRILGGWSDYVRNTDIHNQDTTIESILQQDEILYKQWKHDPFYMIPVPARLQKKE